MDKVIPAVLDHLNLGAYYSFRLIKIQTKVFSRTNKYFCLIVKQLSLITPVVLNCNKLE